MPWVDYIVKKCGPTGESRTWRREWFRSIRGCCFEHIGDRMMSSIPRQLGGRPQTRGSDPRVRPVGEQHTDNLGAPRNSSLLPYWPNEAPYCQRSPRRRVAVLSWQNLRKNTA